MINDWIDRHAPLHDHTLKTKITALIIALGTICFLGAALYLGTLPAAPSYIQGADMIVVYTLDPIPIGHGPSVFLAGPTQKPGPIRTVWRMQALERLQAQKFRGVVFIPEFADGDFVGHKSRDHITDEMIVRWESKALAAATVQIFWLPLGIPIGSGDTMAGNTARLELGYAIAANPGRIVIGSPVGAQIPTWIPVQAQDREAAYLDKTTIEQVIDEALNLIPYLGNRCQGRRC